MKANEFVKKFGIEYTATICKMSANANVSFEDNFVHVDDLKRLVASHELVEFYGGVDKAKHELEDPMIDASDAWDLKQAILDVEGCQ